MGTLKPLTDVANRRKTMGTLKLLTRKHAILETLNLKTLLYWVASLKTLLREKKSAPLNCFNKKHVNLFMFVFTYKALIVI